MKHLFWCVLGALLVWYGSRQKDGPPTRTLFGEVTAVDPDGAIHVVYQADGMVCTAAFTQAQIKVKNTPPAGAAARLTVPADNPTVPISMMLTKSRIAFPAFPTDVNRTGKKFMIAGWVLIAVGILAAIAGV